MKFSLSTFVFYRYELTYAIEKIKEIGYDGVEIWGGKPHAYCYDMTDEEIKKIKGCLEENCLEVSNFIPAQFRYPTNLADTNEIRRKNSVDFIKRSCDVSEALGSPYTSLCSGYSVYPATVDEAYEALLKSIDEIAEHTKGYKQKLIVEPAHPMETDLIKTVDDGIKLINTVGKDKLGLCVDTGHLFVNKESLTEVYDKTKGYTVHYHIDDNYGNSDDHLSLGEGKIDFSTYLAKLEKNNYQGFLAVELGFGYTTDPYIASRNSLKYLKERVK